MFESPFTRMISSLKYKCPPHSRGYDMARLFDSFVSRWQKPARVVRVNYPLQVQVPLIDWLLMFVNQAQVWTDLTAHNWQKWKKKKKKSAFPTCHCHKLVSTGWRSLQCLLCNHSNKASHIWQTILIFNCIYLMNILRPSPAKLEHFYLFNPLQSQNFDLFFNSITTKRYVVDRPYYNFSKSL